MLTTAHTPTFASLRAAEFSRLDAEDHAYLDFTGSALYPESLVARHAAVLRDRVLGNPHSESPASRASTDRIAAARSAVLRFFDADPSVYGVVFTANASGALRLVGEGFPFAPDVPLLLAADNHNSVNGLREFARRAGATVEHLPLDATLRLRDPSGRLAVARSRRRTGGLLAFPAQSNFSGVRHALSLVREAQDAGLRVLLDAAAYVPTSRLRLRDTPADFVALSFYKMFGYPSGVGALLARHDALAELRRPWFAGGVVDYVSVQHGTHRRRDGVEGFEDGTPNFLAIDAVSSGLALLERIGVERIGAHAVGLTRRLASALAALRHRDGRPMVIRYGPDADDADRGPTLAFNVLDVHGDAIPFAVVEAAAAAARVSVRGGCFCNPGASEAAFGFEPERVGMCLAAAGASWSLERFADCMRGHAVGAVRASCGMASNAADVDRLVDVVSRVAVAHRS